MNLNAFSRFLCFVVFVALGCMAQTPCDSLPWLNTCHNFYRLPRLLESFQLPSRDYPNSRFPQFAYQTRVACDRYLTFQTCSRLSNVPNAISIYDSCPIGNPDAVPIRFSDSSGDVSCSYGNDRAVVFRVNFEVDKSYYVFIQAQRPQDVGGNFELLIHDYNCHQCGNPVADYRCPLSPTPGVAPSFTPDESLPNTDGLEMCQISIGDMRLEAEETATVGFEVPHNMAVYKTYLYYKALLPELSTRPRANFRYFVDYLGSTLVGRDVSFFFRGLDRYAISALDLEPMPVRLLQGDSATVTFYLDRGLGAGTFREVRLRLYFRNTSDLGPFFTRRRTPAPIPIRTPTSALPLPSSPPSNRSPTPRPIPSGQLVRTPPRVSSPPIARTPTRVRTPLIGRTPTRARTSRFSPRPTSPFCLQAREFDEVTLTCPAGQFINAIVFADWGRAIGLCPSPLLNIGCSMNVQNYLVPRCVGRFQCGFIVSNQLFGADPCAGSSKFFNALWTCSTSRVVPPRATPRRRTYTVRASQGDFATTLQPFVLACNKSRPSDTIVGITSAVYGTPSGCLAPSAAVMSNVRARCLSYHSCSLRLSRRTLGFIIDPCPVTQPSRLSLSVVASCSLTPATQPLRRAFALLGTGSDGGGGDGESSTALSISTLTSLPNPTPSPTMMALCVGGALGVVAVALASLLAHRMVKTHLRSSVKAVGADETMADAPFKDYAANVACQEDLRFPPSMSQPENATDMQVDSLSHWMPLNAACNKECEKEHMLGSVTRLSPSEDSEQPS
mmetsp:Transcript_5411/g.8419  ORF Transcript_5411/g.8419 Transcript_5411/m.8419 type:complete len:783 (-) Transcript_5411:768-3116(-)|eukprot:CAMPEP_0184646584 /NCGR_PEP_ID=MMETSP0308-20130426/3297_1 /TAXON_ID=38269 /ORGANISM="Gloeochaete witrockiana, Strain SAG 46.84" /LENGTH=782 /DNA_ID=CAMNT_0027076725 /DNA_START=110 /DNA_END=2458 /DNA_ORIENTATION=+